ncbi:MAG TPA: CPBP family intramembrane glutamic endopeptidase [Paucimonas sp.]|nr:CPBP family intramembrane glutamic endopeptidase [Paucimonas sp.]
MPIHSAPFWITFGSLGLAIASLLWPAGNTGHPVRRYLWLALFAVAVAAGLVGGFLRPAALLSIGMLFLAAYLATRSSVKPVVRAGFTILTLLLSLALALHAIPGYANPQLLKDVQFSNQSAPFTMYANFDKGMVGLVLLLFFCRRSSSWSDFVAACRQQAPLAVILLAVVFGLGWAMGFIRPDVKFPAFLPVFAAINLLFVCVAEETFFRGVIQEKIAAALARPRHGEAVALVVSGLLFGLAHLGGGWKFALLASVAGLGYAALYARTRRIEIPILAHFLLNLIHFVGFTYPQALSPNLSQAL